MTEDPRKYIRIAADLRRRISRGELQPGKPAPPITAFCEEYECARQTAARAMRLLAGEGLLVRYPGLGYYVAAPGKTDLWMDDLLREFPPRSPRDGTT